MKQSLISCCIVPTGVKPLVNEVMLRTDGDFHCFSSVLFLCMHLGNPYFCWVASLYIWTFSAFFFFFQYMSEKTWGQYRPHIVLMQSYFCLVSFSLAQLLLDFSQAYFFFPQSNILDFISGAKHVKRVLVISGRDAEICQEKKKKVFRNVKVDNSMVMKYY